jgi:hypothetical protein
MTETDSARLLSMLETMGVDVTTDGTRLHVSAPKGVLTPDLKAALVEHKVALLAMLTPAMETATAPAPLQAGADLAESARALTLPIDRLDRVLRITAPWLDVPLYFVPEAEDSEALVVAGEATRGAVWTRRELLEVLTVRLSKAAVRRVALARVLFDGELGEVALPLCYACRGRDWWRARDQRRVCRRCHPPVPGAEAGTAIGRASL